MKYRRAIATGLLGAVVLPLGFAAAAGAQDETGGRQRGERAAQIQQRVADALGISVEELKAAREEARAAKPETPPTDKAARREDALNRMATALGKTTDELKAALKTAAEAGLDDAVAAGKIDQATADAAKAKLDAGEAPRDVLRSIRGEKAKERIAAAVESGKLTQEQADKIIARIDEGKGPFRPGKRLDKAVENGKLTQEQADQIKERVKNGERLRDVLADLGISRGGKAGTTTTTAQGN